MCLGDKTHHCADLGEENKAFEYDLMMYFILKKISSFTNQKGLDAMIRPRKNKQTYQPNYDL